MKSLSHVQLLATPWTAAYQAPPSMGFSRQEYWKKKKKEKKKRVLEWVASAFSMEAGIVVLNSFSFSLSVKLLISP